MDAEQQRVVGYHTLTVASITHAGAPFVLHFALSFVPHFALRFVLYFVLRFARA